jgi:hypothetical protein
MPSRKTTTILAVVITATAAACGGVTENPQSTREALARELATTSLSDALARRDHFMPLCDPNASPLPDTVAANGGTTVKEFCDAVATPTPQPQPTPDPKPACDLDALNHELSTGTLLDDAIANRAHFRCLCDDKGYPLVGNINAKGATASQFCAALRDKGLL